MTDEHWVVVNFLRGFWHEHGVQCEVRKMVKYFRQQWGKEKGSSSYLHRISPRWWTTETRKPSGGPVTYQGVTLIPSPFPNIMEKSLGSLPNNN